LANTTATDIWKRPGPLGKFQATFGLGSVAAPLFAGFSLTTIALLLTTEAAKRPPLSDWAVSSFAIAAVLSIFAIQFSSMANGYAVPPADRLTWFPEATVDQADLQWARELQAVDLALANRYASRAGLCYELGLLAFLVGLIALVVPVQWSVLALIPVAVSVSSAIVEVCWLIARRLNPRNWLRKLLLPGRENVQPPEVSELNSIYKRAVMKDGSEVD
jgi:MFS family permease